MAKRKPKLICELCSESMEVVRTIPAAALLPELQTFRCNGCECFATLEPDEIKARALEQKGARKVPKAAQTSVATGAAE